MKKSLIAGLFVLSLLSLVSAVTIFSGESVTLQLSEPYEYYSVVGNSSEVLLNISVDGNNVTITPDKYSQEDSYEVIFLNKEKETITIYSSSGGSGGSSSTKYVYKNVTEYKDRNVTKYLEKEVPGETTEVEKIVKKTSWLPWIIAGVFAVVIIYLVFPRREEDEYEDTAMVNSLFEDDDTHTDVRGSEQDE